MKVKKMVDLSWEISDTTPIYPGDPEPHIETTHTIEKDYYNLSGVYVGTQTGSHVDSPYHFRNDGDTIDKMEPHKLVRGASRRADIAYEYEGELVMGCVYMPDNDEMFVAVRGEGATMNGQPIHVSDISDPREAIVHFGYGHRVEEDRRRMMKLLPGLLDNISDLRRFGSAAYAICCVACGRSEIFFERSLHLYDIAGGLVVLEEAGGKSSGWPNEESHLITGNVLLTNGLLHDFMLEQIAE